MRPRDTQNVDLPESSLLAALRRGGYACQTRVKVGVRPGGKEHRVRAVASKGSNRILVSVRRQRVRNSAEQTIPFEVICLAKAVLGGAFSKAYLVLTGDGWALKEFYTDGGLQRHLAKSVVEAVRVVPAGKFAALAGKGEL